MDDENDFVFITQIVAATIIDVDEVMPTMWMNNNSRRPFCVHHFYEQFDSIFANANFDTNEVVEQVREIVLSAGVIGVFFFFLYWDGNLPITMHVQYLLLQIELSY